MQKLKLINKSTIIIIKMSSYTSKGKIQIVLDYLSIIL